MDASPSECGMEMQMCPCIDRHGNDRLGIKICQSLALSLPSVSWLRHTWVCLVYGNFYVKLWAACGWWPGTQTIRASLTSPWPWLLLHIIIWIITMMMITNRRYYPKISGYLTQVIFGDRISPRYQPPTMTHLILQQPAAGPHRPWLLTTGPH